MSERNYYVLCDSNCKFPAMTKEQIIAAIAEATGNTPTNIDDAFITKIRETNKNAALKFWFGTVAEYNALTEKDGATIYIKSDDDIDEIIDKIANDVKEIEETLSTDLTEAIGKPWKLVKKYTAAGSYTWTCPEDGEYVALIVGGGGSGGCIASLTDDESVYVIAEGGSAGQRNYYRGQIAANDKIALVVGAGGASVTVNSDSGNMNPNARSGGTSSFNGVTATGGEGGKGSKPTSGSQIMKGAASGGWDGMSLFMDENNIPATVACGGGSVRIYRASVNYGSPSYEYVLPSNEAAFAGKIGSPALGGTWGDFPIVGVTPTDCGAGSGGVAAILSSGGASDLSITAASGADGGVFIYKVRSMIDDGKS